MRTKPANRYNNNSTHAQYGIYKWFKSKGIKEQEIIKEVVINFCNDNGFKTEKKVDIHKAYNYASNRFEKLAVYAVKYLKENNY